MSLVAIALGCGMTTASTNARAEESEDTTESTETLVTSNENDDDFLVEPSREDAERRLDVVNRDWHRRGYIGCYSYCDDLRNSCMRRDDRGYDDWRWRDLRRWDDRRHGNNAYRRCERRFDFCIEVCRDNRWRNR